MKNLSLERDVAVLEQPVARRSERMADRTTESFRPGSDLSSALENLGELLGVEDPTSLQETLTEALFRPLDEAASNPGKRIRSQLVGLSHRLVKVSTLSDWVEAKSCRLAAQAVEMIHLGSLIVDDIEDGSQVRRGRPALHMRHGLPLALNAGNWLYFWSAEMLRRLDLPVNRTVLLYELYHRTMLRAHFGQTADLGCRVETLAQAAVAPACLATMELKTGALMGFAAALGGATAGASERAIRLLDEFGKRLGVALQMFDDLGNVIGRCEPAKRFEDLLMKRLCWVWACAAEVSSAEEYRNFIAAVGALPNEAVLNDWIARRELIPYVRQSARSHLEDALRYLKQELNQEGLPWSKGVFNELRNLSEEIAVAYE